MARILFISINDVVATGIRNLSAKLKQNNHQPYILFLKKSKHIYRKIEEYDWVGIDERGRKFRYARGPEITNKEKTIILSFIKEIVPDLIGFTVTTPLKTRNGEIARLIKSAFDVPIIWGGPEPTINPQDCLNYCDIVHIGEADETIVDIATLIDQKKDVKDVENLAYLKDSKFIRNRLHTLTTDLDKLPFKDMDPHNKFLIESDLLVKNYSGICNNEAAHTYHMTTSRGCPYNCSYCCENFYKKLYPSEVFLRRRTPSNVIQELKEAKNLIDYERVIFEDEVFSLDIKWLEEFRSMYKSEVGLPLVCYIHPNRDIEKQLKILKEIGLIYTCLAIQSGSEKINRDIFNRHFDKDLFLKTANILKSFDIRFYTDVITFNPIEEEKDLQATLSILNELPKCFGLCVNKLYISKGTKIYDLLNDFVNNRKKWLVSEKIFLYYSHLFWLTTKYNKFFVKLVEKSTILKRFPFLFTLFIHFLIIARSSAVFTFKIFRKAIYTILRHKN